MNNLRYQVYGLKTDNSLDKPITIPIDTKERAYKYYIDCVQCALVAINENGVIVDIIEKNTKPINNKNKKPKTIRRNL